ncbi:hypothetical protein [Streptomyces malaysiense]|uniref:Uncharacterized protein n=1 Tax=Streptomyces malaysiense TaxID=1428626 RepID=A0A1J4PVS5_9ACTN|nr:hypothetical protein [Streptomyces malaysiense]OIK24071.1 hypothetical protein VT52_029070 [Streptomyces malaysiense]
MTPLVTAAVLLGADRAADCPLRVGPAAGAWPHLIHRRRVPERFGAARLAAAGPLVVVIGLMLHVE